jgi:putative transposase
MPVASPGSNGLCDALARTLKRDHVQVRPLPDAAAAVAQIAGWIEDYNENHPHTGVAYALATLVRPLQQPAEVSG